MTTTIWRLSQAHLNLFATCPRKFQYIYLEQFMSPCIGEQPNLNLGTRFHRLMQQRELGLPTEAILEGDEPLKQCFQALAKAAPDLVYSQANTWRKAEHLRTYLKGKFLLSGIYDLLILTPTKAQIVDWKTYSKPPKSQTIANNWQTRLYLYLLAETSNYSPEEIELIYWFINPKQTKSMTVSYSTEQHQTTEHDLNQMLTQLTAYWEQYQNHHQPFPQVEESKGYCLSCQFTIPCNRHPQKDQGEISLDEVEEMSI